MAGGVGRRAARAAASDTRTVVAHDDGRAGADVRLEVRDDGSTLVAAHMPRAARAGASTRSGSSARARDPEPTSVLWSTRADGSAEVAVPGSLDGVEAVLVTDEPGGRLAGADAGRPCISVAPA